MCWLLTPVFSILAYYANHGWLWAHLTVLVPEETHSHPSLPKLGSALLMLVPNE